MLELSKIGFERGRHRVLDDFNLRLAPGERLGLVGASGVGKSSVLDLVSGLLTPSSGEVSNEFRRTCLVFQTPRLLPWRNVRDNLIIPLRSAGHPRAAATALADDWLNRVGLARHAHAWPGSLSGGMAQRVALARAFALEPDLLMLDEPFSALDPALRRELGELCDAELTRTGAALLCVSHHPTELADRVDRCVRLESGRAWPHVLPAREIPRTTGHPAPRPSGLPEAVAV